MFSDTPDHVTYGIRPKTAILYNALHNYAILYDALRSTS